jgi:uncharacterized protein
LFPEFRPLIPEAHLLTIAGNFWPREIDEARFPGTRRIYEVDSATNIVVLEHQPLDQPRGQLVFIHGLEGSSDAGYIKSFAQNALSRGFGVHRANLRTCGGTEELCRTMYHSGLTSDTRFILERIQERNLGPIFLVGFSLGGNVTLKLAGELGDTKLLAGACAVSTPIDLAACVRCLDRLSNRVYARRFLNSLKARVRRKNRLFPELYPVDRLDKVKTIWQFDDLFTAPLFGFGTAANYYATQSSVRFLELIRIPTLAITAQDDPLVPFSMYRDPVFDTNPVITLLAPSHGGHLGFLSRGRPRFWIDEAALRWIELQTKLRALRGTNLSPVTSGSVTS